MLVVYAATRNLYWYLPTTIGSLLRHNPTWQVLVCCEDDFIETLNDPRVSFLNINSVEIPLPADNPNLNTKFTAYALVRCYLPRLLPEEDLILYLDVDTLVYQSLSELEYIDMTNFAIAAVPEYHSTATTAIQLNISRNTYINSGVLLMNLAFIRAQNLDTKWLALLSKKSFSLPDQDAINLTCQGFIYFLPIIYNYGHSTAGVGIYNMYSLDNIKIQHFTRTKLWDNPIIKCWRSTYIKQLGDEPEL